MNKMQQQVKEFHDAFGVPAPLKPQLLEPDRIKLRHRLIDEEFLELRTAEYTGDLTAIADSLADLLYVVLGTAVEHGIDMEPIFDEVQRSNMSKLGADGRPHVRADGKILKGPNFTLPAIWPLLQTQMR